MTLKGLKYDFLNSRICNPLLGSTFTLLYFYSFCLKKRKETKHGTKIKLLFFLPFRCSMLFVRFKAQRIDRLLNLI